MTGQRIRAGSSTFTSRSLEGWLAGTGSPYLQIQSSFYRLNWYLSRREAYLLSTEACLLRRKACLSRREAQLISVEKRKWFSSNRCIYCAVTDRAINQHLETKTTAGNSDCDILPQLAEVVGVVSWSLDRKVFVHIGGLVNEGLVSPPPTSGLHPETHRPETRISLRKQVTRINQSDKVARILRCDAHAGWYSASWVNLHNFVSVISGVTGPVGSSRTTCLLTRGILAMWSCLKNKVAHAWNCRVCETSGAS